MAPAHGAGGNMMLWAGWSRAVFTALGRTRTWIPRTDAENNNATSGSKLISAPSTRDTRQLVRISDSVQVLGADYRRGAPTILDTSSLGKKIFLRHGRLRA